MNKEETETRSSYRFDDLLRDQVSVDLGYNRIGSFEITALCESISEPNVLNTLTSLNLRRNNINEESSYYLGEYLRKNHKLEKLDLSNNCISDEGCRHIVHSLRGNTTLKLLNLLGNNISETGGRYF